MGTAFEVAVILHLQVGLPHEDTETLAYMTRSQEYDFQTLLSDSFFTECEEGFEDEWRNIIAHNYPCCNCYANDSRAAECALTSAWLPGAES